MIGRRRVSRWWVKKMKKVSESCDSEVDGALFIQGDEPTNFSLSIAVTRFNLLKDQHLEKEGRLCERPS